MRTLLRLLPENMRVCVISKFITKVVRPTDAVQLILEKRVHHTVWILPLLGKGQSISFQGFHRAMGWVHDCIYQALSKSLALKRLKCTLCICANLDLNASQCKVAAVAILYWQYDVQLRTENKYACTPFQISTKVIKLKIFRCRLSYLQPSTSLTKLG